MTPTRIQRQRGPKGYKHPDGTMYVSRTGHLDADGNDRCPWANPFKVKDHGRTEAVRLFREHAVARLIVEPDWLDPLRDARYIACWCSPEDECHGDVLLELIEVER